MTDVLVIQTVIGLFTISSLLFGLSLIKIHKININYQEVLLKNKTLQSDISVMCTAAANLGEHIDKLDANIRILTARQNKHELDEPQTRSFSQARVLLGNGADIVDVIDNCGMSYGEAELIAAMKKLETRQSN